MKDGRLAVPDSVVRSHRRWWRGLNIVGMDWGQRGRTCVVVAPGFLQKKNGLISFFF